MSRETPLGYNACCNCHLTMRHLKIQYHHFSLCQKHHVHDQTNDTLALLQTLYFSKVHFPNGLLTIHRVSLQVVHA